MPVPAVPHPPSAGQPGSAPVDLALDALAEPMAPEPEPPRVHLSPRQWVRANLFPNVFSSLLSLVFGAALAAMIYFTARWVLVSAEWTVVRVNLRQFMIGRSFPSDEHWRIWASLAVMVTAVGIAGGIARRYSRHIAEMSGEDEDHRPVLNRLVHSSLTLLQRFWPVLLAVIVVLGFTRTWAPLLATLALAVWFALTRFLGSILPLGARRWLWVIVVVGLIGAYQVVMLGADGVSWDLWGGLYLTVFATITGIALAFPLGLLLALGRYTPSLGLSTTLRVLVWIVPFIAVLSMAFGFGLVSLPELVIGVVATFIIGSIVASFWRPALPGVRILSVSYIEAFRAVPLVTLLFMGQNMVGFLFPTTVSLPSDLTRAIIVIALFEAAYIAEIVRGGLQSVPRGQIEAAQAIGLSTTGVQRLIVLPQALRAVIPAMVGQFISLFKDTSLLALIGLIEMTRVANTVTSQAGFLGLAPVTLAFVGFLYWAGCITMSKESRRLERRLGIGER